MNHEMIERLWLLVRFSHSVPGYASGYTWPSSPIHLISVNTSVPYLGHGSPSVLKSAWKGVLRHGLEDNAWFAGGVEASVAKRGSGRRWIISDPHVWNKTNTAAAAQHYEYVVHQHRDALNCTGVELKISKFFFFFFLYIGGSQTNLYWTDLGQRAKLLTWKLTNCGSISAQAWKTKTIVPNVKTSFEGHLCKRKWKEGRRTEWRVEWSGESSVNPSCNFSI